LPDAALAVMGEPPLPPRPEPPDPADCCGSGCVRCIFDLYDEALERWQREVERRRGDGDAGSAGVPPR
jgi:hypothetical protein